MPDPVLSRFLSFLDASPTPFHAVASVASALQEAGFARIDPGGPTPRPPPGTRGYVVARGGAIVAFRMGSEPPESAGFRVVAAHTDSPNLRIKPVPAVRSHGYVRLGVEPYGGLLHSTWADRDLGLAGRVTVRDGQGLRSALVRLERPILRIPNLAIHLNREVNTKGLVLNAQTQLPPVIALEAPDADAGDPVKGLLAQHLGVEASDVLAWDLSLFDLTPAVCTGIDDAFVASGRLDNLASCHAGLEALIAADDPRATAVLALFDHEEVGSRTSRGADSRTLESVLGLLVGDGSLDRALHHTWLVSADMAHAVHPAHPELHDAAHMPRLNAGPVIKTNANARYGTESETAAMFLLLCERADVPVQWFVNRADLACGSTVGPILAGRLGVRTVDVGNPMLSMHSAREMCGTQDHPRMIAVLTSFFATGSLG